jgi:hypothetical protein
MRARLIKLGLPVVVLLALAGGGVAWATAGDDDELVTGPEADRASAAAVEHVGGGRVIGVERESEEGGVWEVEIARADGSTVEVQLDASYTVVGSGDEEDEDGSEGDEGDD